MALMSASVGEAVTLALRKFQTALVRCEVDPDLPPSQGSFYFQASYVTAHERGPMQGLLDNLSRTLSGGARRRDVGTGQPSAVAAGKSDNGRECLPRQTLATVASFHLDNILKFLHNNILSLEARMAVIKQIARMISCYDGVIRRETQGLGDTRSQHDLRVTLHSQLSHGIIVLLRPLRQIDDIFSPIRVKDSSGYNELRLDHLRPWEEDDAVIPLPRCSARIVELCAIVEGAGTRAGRNQPDGTTVLCDDSCDAGRLWLPPVLSLLQQALSALVMTVVKMEMKGRSDIVEIWASRNESRGQRRRGKKGLARRNEKERKGEMAITRNVAQEKSFRERDEEEGSISTLIVRALSTLYHGMCWMMIEGKSDWRRSSDRKDILHLVLIDLLWRTVGLVRKLNKTWFVRSSQTIYLLLHCVQQILHGVEQVHGNKGGEKKKWEEGGKKQGGEWKGEASNNVPCHSSRQHLFALLVRMATVPNFFERLRSKLPRSLSPFLFVLSSSSLSTTPFSSFPFSSSFFASRKVRKSSENAISLISRT